ncbi:MAG: GGDEF domain-containing protein [Clostridia bacterium]|nr:GGDEF domain-containing protein [Clostridia bacterium]
MCITIGILSFCALSYGLNTASFVLVFLIMAMFVMEQNNKIKVDNLTKLYNRYGMDVELKEQLKQYEREHSDSFYIIACDLDNFKYINDTWGHPEGDRALILVAGALARVGKKFSANVFRIGGDEFVIITDTSEEGLAIDVTNAIKTELDNIDFRNDYDIEMSIGVALYDGVTPIDELLSNADKKLYEAKKKIK